MSKVMYNGQEVEAIDCAPSWKQTLHMMLAVLESGNAQGKKDAKVVLSQMADVADKLVELQKSQLLDKSIAAFNVIRNTQIPFAGQRIRTYDLASEIGAFLDSIKVN